MSAVTVRSLVLLCVVSLVVFIGAAGYGALFPFTLFVFLIIFTNRALPLHGLSAVPIGGKIRRPLSRGPPSA